MPLIERQPYCSDGTTIPEKLLVALCCFVVMLDDSAACLEHSSVVSVLGTAQPSAVDD